MNITYALYLLQHISVDLYGHHQVVAQTEKRNRSVQQPDDSHVSRPKHVMVNIMNV